MKVLEIWRYPVKTMAGEKLQREGSGLSVSKVTG